MSSANLVPRSGPTLSRVLTRLLVTAGLACAAWLLGALLTGQASADEIDSGSSGTGQTGTVSAMPVDQPTSAPAPVPDDPTPGPSTPPASGTPDAPAPKPVEEPAARKTSKPATSDQQEVSSPARNRTVTPKQRDGGETNDGGLIGGLVGGLLSTVTNTVSTVTDTVGGLIGSVGDAVVAPIACPTPPHPSPGNGSPGDGDGDGWILPTLPWFDGGSSGSGGTVTIAVPGARPGHSPFPDLPGGTLEPGAVPAVPPQAPAIGGIAAGSAPTRAATSESFRPGADYGAIATGRTVTLAGKVVVKADQEQGGGSGGGQAPFAPSAPSVPTCAAGTGHDHGGGHRHPFAIAGSAANHTQLELIGTSRDHSADGAGRDAALPTASPD